MNEKPVSASDYSALQRQAVRDVRMETAQELTAQAEQLMRLSEHHTFASALALLERLRAGEPSNAGLREQILQRIAK